MEDNMTDYRDTNVWKAGPAYQPYGQIIGAIYYGPGRIFFRDFSRGLNCDLLGAVPRMMGYEQNEIPYFLRSTINKYYIRGWYTPTTCLTPSRHEELTNLILEAEDDDVKDFLRSADRGNMSVPEKLQNLR